MIARVGALILALYGVTLEVDTARANVITSGLITQSRQSGTEPATSNPRHSSTPPLDLSGVDYELFVRGNPRAFRVVLAGTDFSGYGECAAHRGVARGEGKSNRKSI